MFDRVSMRRLRGVSTVFVVFLIAGLLFGSPGMTTIGAPALNQTGFDVPSAGKIIVVLKDGTFGAAA